MHNEYRKPEELLCSTNIEWKFVSEVMKNWCLNFLSMILMFKISVLENVEYCHFSPNFRNNWSTPSGQVECRNNFTRSRVKLLLELSVIPIYESVSVRVCMCNIMENEWSRAGGYDTLPNLHIIYFTEDASMSKYHSFILSFFLVCWIFSIPIFNNISFIIIIF